MWFEGLLKSIWKHWAILSMAPEFFIISVITIVSLSFLAGRFHYRERLEEQKSRVARLNDTISQLKDKNDEPTRQTKPSRPKPVTSTAIKSDASVSAVAAKDQQSPSPQVEQQAIPSAPKQEAIPQESEYDAKVTRAEEIRQRLAELTDYYGKMSDAWSIIEKHTPFSQVDHDLDSSNKRWHLPISDFQSYAERLAGDLNYRCNTETKLPTIGDVNRYTQDAPGEGLLQGSSKKLQEYRRARLTFDAITPSYHKAHKTLSSELAKLEREIG